MLIYVNLRSLSSIGILICAQVYVLSPIRISFLPSRVEAEVGSTLTLPLAVYGMLGKLQMTINIIRSIIAVNKEMCLEAVVISSIE